MAPLCPHCLCATAYAADGDWFVCLSPVCRGRIPSEWVANTPRWRQLMGWWRRTYVVDDVGWLAPWRLKMGLL